MLKTITLLTIILWGGLNILAILADRPNIVTDRVNQIDAAVSQALQAPITTKPGQCPDNDPLGTYGAPCEINWPYLDPIMADIADDLNLKEPTP